MLINISIQLNLNKNSYLFTTFIVSLTFSNIKGRIEKKEGKRRKKKKKFLMEGKKVNIGEKTKITKYTFYSPKISSPKKN